MSLTTTAVRTITRACERRVKGVMQLSQAASTFPSPTNVLRLSFRSITSMAFASPVSNVTRFSVGHPCAPASPFSIRTLSTADGYLAQKKAAKDRRRELFESQQERLVRLKTRRAGRPRNLQRREFWNWFLKKKVNEEYMDRKARQAGLEWKMNVAVILVRNPVVLPDLEPWEEEYDELQTYLGQFGKVYPKEMMGMRNQASETPQKLILTNEELLAMLPKGFVPAPRETEADHTGNVKTYNRRLKTDIFLTVQEGEHWGFPSVELQKDETFLAAAKRVLSEKIGPQVEYWTISNCPWAVDVKAFPEEERTKNGFYGIKTFFMRINHDEGEVSEEQVKVKDYAWLDRVEMVERVKNEQGEQVSKLYRYML